jgi:hypothetical protein
MMNLGEGISAIFSEKPASPPVEVKPGQMIGQFRLASVNEQEAVFEWDGKTIRKRLHELMDRTIRDNEAAVARTAAVAPQAPAVVKAPVGPGPATNAGTRACVVNDDTPPGAVVDGFRKVVVETVFGPACRWEPVK